MATSTNAGQFETPATWTQNGSAGWEQSAHSAALAINRVRELHKPFTRKVPALWSNAGELETLCAACEVQNDSATYPCPTIQALDGEIGSVEPVKLEALDGEQS